MGLFDALQTALGQEEAITALLPSAGIFKRSDDAAANEIIGPVAGGAPKPILQLNAFPVTLEPDDYSDPLTNANPSGKLTSLWAFRQLVDPIPAFARYYSSSGGSTERTYAALAGGAATANPTSFVGSIIGDGQRMLAQSVRYNIDGQPGTWLPIFATPEDWTDTSAGRYLPLAFDPNAAGTPESPFDIIAGNQNPFALSIRNNQTNSLQTQALTGTVKQINLNYLQVTLSRPWLNSILFKTAGWYLSGQAKGFCSSGMLSRNNGALPLLPVSVILATDVSVDAQWSSADSAVLAAAADQGSEVSLGPFLINAPSGTPPIQVVGWVSELIPYCPTIEGP